MSGKLIKINKLKLVRFIYWFFLTYMVAAFIWWYISLEKQNNEIATIKSLSLQTNDYALAAKANAIKEFQNRKTKQFIGEGLTFLLLFLVGAIYVYRSLLKQLRYADQQQNFMMAVTHELKTPIAVAHLNVETLLKRELDTSQQTKLLEATLKETKRLDQLSTNILLASQLDRGDYKVTKQTVDMSTLVMHLIKSFQDRFPQRECKAVVAEGIQIQAEPLLIQLLINNLIDFSEKYKFDNKLKGYNLDIMKSKGKEELKKLMNYVLNNKNINIDKDREIIKIIMKEAQKIHSFIETDINDNYAELINLD